MKRWWFVAASLWLLAACQPQHEKVVEIPLQEGVAVGVAHEPEPQIDKERLRLEAFVEKNADAFVDYAMRAAAPPSFSQAIRGLLDQPKAAKALVSSEYGDLKLPGLKHVELLREIYANREDVPIFFQGTELRAAVSPFVETLRDLDARGLTPKMLDPTACLASLDKLLPTSDALNAPFILSSEERAALVDHLQAHPLDIADSQVVRAWIDRMLGEETVVPRLKAHVEAKKQDAGDDVRWAALADILLVDHLMTYARIVHFNNRTHLTAEETATLGNKPSSQKYDMIAMARMRPWLDEIIQAQSEEAFRHQLQSLYPVHPQYERLVEAHRRYAALPDWQTVKAAKVTPHKASPVVPKLRLRLAAEGYYHGDVHEDAQKMPEFEVYDNDIRAAVRVYHDTHQLDYDEKKGLQKEFWTSLNVPRLQRLQIIDENIRRWYSTYLVPSDYFIYVNVPDFHGEVWKDGQRVHRFPVVAGSARRSCNPETKQWYYINATPLMHAKMLYVEYNPYWNVPMRIEQEDYIEKINADPTWLETHGFEYYTENGHTILRQLPSENNALGRVKFIFPNPHSTFLHDSPQKRFFKYPIRAFSHGCMRVWEPLKLAEILLKLDGQWYEGLAAEIEDFQTRRIVFKNKFDVFIDYYTVRVDDDGLVYFLSDPYRYVKDALNPPTPKQQQCKPSLKQWIPRTSLQQGGEDVGSDGEDVGSDEVTGVE